MKKIFLVVVAVLACATLSQAQLKIGAKAGVNISTLDFEAEGFSFSPDSKIGGHFGLMAKTMFSEQFGLQPELLYSMEGASIEDEDFNVNYVNIPVLLTWNPSEIFNIHLGPQFGVLVAAEAGDEDVKDELTSLNLSLAAGAAVELENGFTGGVRYNLGLSDLNDTEDEFEIKANTFQIYVGYFFRR
jgi:hypothetical protein